MTNKEIIANAAVKLGLYTVDEAQQMLNEGVDIPLHTLNGWNRLGHYRIKDGAEGIEVRLWRRKEDGKGFYKSKAYLYRKEQLEKIG